jgi:hypothetical protein
MKILKKYYLILFSLMFVQLHVQAFCRLETVKGSPSVLFKLKINGSVVPVTGYMDFDYAQFYQKGTLNIEVEFTEKILDVKVSPLSRKIQVTRSAENKVKFQLNTASYTVVTINKQNRLFLFGENYKELLSPKPLKITDYVNNKGTEIATPAIQKALDDASTTGKSLIFPAGTYLSGSLFIHDNTNVIFQEGAVLKASDDISKFSYNNEIRAPIFITISNAQHVRINGLGAIDCSGKVLREKFGDKGRLRLLVIYASKDVEVSNITLRDPGTWNTHIYRSQHVLLSRLKLLNNPTLPTSDGFDPDASSDVTIKDCFAYTSDDNVAIKLTPKDTGLKTSEITIRGCVFLTLKSSLKVGTETRGTSISNVLFENNDIIRSDRGISIYCSDGAEINDIKYINNRFEENYPDLRQMCMEFRINQRTPESRVGVIKNVLVKDCQFLEAFPKPSAIRGMDADHKVEVTFDNLTIQGKKCTNIDEANIKTAIFSTIRFQ